MHYNDPESIPGIWEVGDIILEKYVVRDVFRGGGMGLVYRVYHNEWNIELAVKSPRSEYFQTCDALTSFEKEAETWVNLGLHPQITSCYYVRRLGGIPRIFTEYVNRGSLADNILARKLYEGEPQENLEKILDIAIQFAWGIQFAHENDLIHLDIKPGNVLINSDGDVKVTDFGLAAAKTKLKYIDPTSTYNGQTIFVKGSGYMTPAYASPEQANGEHLSTKTDIWSWAVSVLEMMKGEIDWSHGQVAAHALEAYYGESIVCDPLAILLRECFERDASRRPNAENCAQRLIGIYESHLDKQYVREYVKKEYISSDVFNNRGLSMLDLGSEDDAIKEFKKSLNQDANNIGARYNLLITEWRSGKVTDEDVIRELWEHKTPKNESLVYEALENINKERGVDISTSQNELSEENILSKGLNCLVQLQDKIIYIRGRKSKEGFEVFSVTRQGYVYIHNEKGTELYTTSLNAQILECDISQDWKYLLYATKEGGYSRINRLTISTTTKNPIINSKHYHNGLTYCLDVLDHNVFLTSGEDKVIVFWNIDDLSIHSKIDLSKENIREHVSNGEPFSKRNLAVYSSKLIPSSNKVVTLHTGGVRLWSGFKTSAKTVLDSLLSPSSCIETSYKQYKILKILRSPLDSFPGGQLAVSNDGSFIINGGYVPAIYDGNGNYIRSLSTSDRRIESICITDSNKLVFGSGYCGAYEFTKYRKSILIWSIDSGRLIRTIPIDQENGCQGKTISLIGNGETFLFGTDSGKLCFGTHLVESKSAQYFISRPKSISEIDEAEKNLRENIELVESFIKSHNYNSAHSIVRDLSQDVASFLLPDVQRLEVQIDGIGKKQSIQKTLFERDLSICINAINAANLEQPELNYNLDSYIKFFNTDGSQVLWLPLANSIGDFSDALLFDTKTGNRIYSGNLSNQLWQYGAKGVWCIGGAIGCSKVIYVNSNIKNLSILFKTGKHNIWSYHLSQDEMYALTTSADHNVLWDALNGKPLSIFEYDDKYIITKSCFGNSASQIILALGEHKLIKLELKKEGIFKSIKLKPNLIFANKLSADRTNRDRYLAIVDKETRVVHATYHGIEILCYKSGDLIHYYLENGITSISRVLDSPLVVVGYESGIVKLYNTSSGSMICDLGCIKKPITSLYVTSDGLRLIINGNYVFHLLWEYNFL